MASFCIVFIACLKPLQAATEMPANMPMGVDFELPSTLDRAIKLSEFQDKIVLLNFGYTYCPDICPIVLGKLANLQKSLDPEAEKLQVLFVSFDPERDNLAHLKQYLRHFDKSFVGFHSMSRCDHDFYRSTRKNLQLERKKYTKMSLW